MFPKLFSLTEKQNLPHDLGPGIPLFVGTLTCAIAVFLTVIGVPYHPPRLHNVHDDSSSSYDVVPVQVDDDGYGYGYGCSNNNDTSIQVVGNGGYSGSSAAAEVKESRALVIG